MFDITSVSSVDRCAHASPMEVQDMDGQDLGFQLMVLGAQADAVQKYTNKIHDLTTINQKRLAFYQQLCK